MPSSAFGSHHHLPNPTDSPYTVEISIDGDSSDLDSLSEVDLESGGVTKLHSSGGGGKKRRVRRRKKKKKRKKKESRDCRICHLPLESSKEGEEEEDDDSDAQQEVDKEEDEEDEAREEEYYGLPLQLGCSCKGDLGVAHSKCAETWFKIKGNMTCEICGAMAINVAGEQSNPESTASTTHSQVAATGQTQSQTEPRGIWHGRRVMNFLLAAMVFAFIVSWLFHFKVLK
ncbi:hypothetical protein N665_0198s0164 [Sinapis alba]|nr:hypothetical protein N665_0198s0164 [Sinapis alba]